MFAAPFYWQLPHFNLGLVNQHLCLNPGHFDRLYNLWNSLNRKDPDSNKTWICCSWLSSWRRNGRLFSLKCFVQSFPNTQPGLPASPGYGHYRQSEKPGSGICHQNETVPKVCLASWHTFTNSGLPAFPWPFWHCPFPELSRNSDRRTPLGCHDGGAPPFLRPPPRWKTSISVCERFRVSWHRSHCCPLHQPGILTNTWLLVKWIFFDYRYLTMPIWSQFNASSA